MDRVLRVTLLVLGILVLAAMLFGFGAQLYSMASGAQWGAFAPVPMMRGAWGMHSVGWLGWLPGLGWLIGLGILVLVVVGVVGLARGLTSFSTARRCAHCGYPLQEGWVACPRCGEKV
ncbi:MAG: zinc ribbon domain-containing protein [Chloroflexota bacterium]